MPIIPEINPTDGDNKGRFNSRYQFGNGVTIQ